MLLRSVLQPDAFKITGNFFYAIGVLDAGLLLTDFLTLTNLLQYMNNISNMQLLSNKKTLPEREGLVKNARGDFVEVIKPPYFMPAGVYLIPL